MLGIPSMHIEDAYNKCREGNMTIKNGNSQKEIILYPPAQRLMIENIPMWKE